MAEKLYYSMGEVADMLDVSPSLLRFWEKRFDIIKPQKNKKGNRLFSPDDVRNLKTIYHLVKERGMTLAGAQKQLQAKRSAIERDMEIAERLGTIRALLLEVRNELGGESSNYELRITNYEQSEYSSTEHRTSAARPGEVSREGDNYEQSEVITDEGPQVARSAGRIKPTEVIANYEHGEYSSTEHRTSAARPGEVSSEGDNYEVPDEVVIEEAVEEPEQEPEPEPEPKPKFIEQTLF